MSYSVLVVDDDAELLNIIKIYLENHAFRVYTADNGAQALTAFHDHQPDLVLSDAEMPVLDGHTLCRVLRQETTDRNVPLIIMTGQRIEESSVLAGFENGADDYVQKPFSPAVMMARIEAVLNRYRNSLKSEKKLRADGLEIDTQDRTVLVRGRAVNLTKKEFDLLALLVGKKGHVWSVPALLEHVWGYDCAAYNSARTVETHISSLRRKLGSESARWIKNFPGHGYKFDPQP